MTFQGHCDRKKWIKKRAIKHIHVTIGIVPMPFKISIDNMFAN